MSREAQKPKVWDERAISKASANVEFQALELELLKSNVFGKEELLAEFDGQSPEFIGQSSCRNWPNGGNTKANSTDRRNKLVKTPCRCFMV